MSKYNFDRAAFIFVLLLNYIELWHFEEESGYMSTSFTGFSPTRPHGARERETLENAGHVSPRRTKNPQRVPVSESFVATNFCQHQYEADFFRSRSAMFSSSLQSAIVNSSYWNINIKPKQVKYLEAVYRGKDTVGVLPTGYGKSIILHLLPGLFLAKVSSRSTEQSPIHPVIIVASPLNALISDQIRRSTEGKVKAAILNVRKGKNGQDLKLDDTSIANSSWLKDARYDIIFTHPEAILSCQKGMELFQGQPYQQCVQAIAIDEAHCILEW